MKFACHHNWIIKYIYVNIRKTSKCSIMHLNYCVIFDLHLWSYLINAIYLKIYSFIILVRVWFISTEFAAPPLPFFNNFFFTGEELEDPQWFIFELTISINTKLTFITFHIYVFRLFRTIVDWCKKNWNVKEYLLAFYIWYTCCCFCCIIAVYKVTSIDLHIAKKNLQIIKL